MNINDIITEGLRDPKDNPCWKGYKPVGTKQKGGRTVPNCVPKEGIEEQADWREASAKSNLQPGVPVMIWLGPRNQNPPRDDKKWWERGVVMDSPEWIDGAWRVLVKTDTKSQWPINPERVFVLKKDVAEETTDVYRKVFKKNGKPVGEIGIDLDASPGLDGEWYVKHYASGTNYSGYTRQDAIDELKYMVSQGLDEEYNAEYDDEAGMADNNLETLERAIQGIDDLIHPGDNLPEWCQEKIAIAKSMLVNVWDYMRSEEDRGAVAENDELNVGVEAYGIRGADSRKWRKTFKSQAAFENWLDANEGDVEVLGTREVNLNDMFKEDWQKANRKDKTAGMSRKAVAAYRRENPGSKLQTAVTTKPSKLKKGSKASKRRKSYCSRSKGQMNMHNIDCSKTPDKAICKARRRWNCE